MIGKRVIAALVLFSCAAPAAWAEGSVAVYGIADVAARHVSNKGAGSENSLASGGNLTSRIGFRGSEDVGDGFKAGFDFEAGLFADTGSSVISNQFFDRAAYVNLKNPMYGEIRAGHDLTTVYIVWGIADPFNQVGIGSVVSLYPGGSSTAPNPIYAAFGTNDRNASTTGRSNNTITYYTPNTLGGFNASVSLGAREGSTGTPTALTGHKFRAMTLGYTKGPLSVRGGYALTNTSAVPGEIFRDLAWHAMYDFGFLKASVAQRQYKFRSATENIVQAGLWVPVTAHGTAKFAFGRLNNSGTVGTRSISGNSTHLFAAGYQYDWTATTVLYVTAVRLSNSKTSAVPLNGGPSAGFPAGGTAQGFETGIRHSF